MGVDSGRARNSVFMCGIEGKSALTANDINIDVLLSCKSTSPEWPQASSRAPILRGIIINISSPVWKHYVMISGRARSIGGSTGNRLNVLLS